MILTRLYRPFIPKTPTFEIGSVTAEVPADSNTLSISVDGKSDTTSVINSLSVDLVEANLLLAQYRNQYTTNETSSIRVFTFNEEHTQLFILGINHRLYAYDLSIAGDETTAQYNGVVKDFSSISPTTSDFQFSTDGTKLYVLFTPDGDLVIEPFLFQFNLSNSWDISQTTNAGTIYFMNDEQINCFTFKPDGKKFYFSSTGGDIFYEYTLGTAWQISTYDEFNNKNNSQDHKGRFANHSVTGFRFSKDGTKLYACDRGIFIYSLATAYDIATLDYIDESFLPGQDITYLTINEDETIFYTRYGNQNVRSYLLDKQLNLRLNGLKASIPLTSITENSVNAQINGFPVYRGIPAQNLAKGKQWIDLIDQTLKTKSGIEVAYYLDQSIPHRINNITYDANGNISSKNYPDLGITIHYTYHDAVNGLISSIDDGTYKVDYAYDANDNVTEKNYGVL